MVANMERVGDYILEQKLSQGGMAEVFVARSAAHQRQVVVKSLFQADPKMAAMMIEEARLQAQLSHPNVVQVVDLVEEEGRPYIVMEYLDGKNLRQVLHRAATRSTRIPPATICRIVRDVLAALGYAHARTNDDGAPLGLVHRDVSPANVFLTWSGKVKLIDFGVAKATRGADRGLTRAGEIKGKISYMSPEQIERKPLDGRSDLFAVGIMMWEMLAMRRLFARKTDYETLMAVVRDEIPPPSRFLPGSAELDRICLKALARDRNERYSRAEEMIADLEAVLDGNQVALDDELGELFDDEMEAELIDEAPTMRGEPEAIAALQEAPTDPNLYESWDDAHQSYKARGMSSGWRLVVAAACLLLGAAVASVARQITSAPAAAAMAVGGR
jgi:serine/threonine-protein kinase